MSQTAPDPTNSYVYDAANNRTSTNIAGGSTAYGYTANRVQTATSSTASWTYEYNGNGCMTAKKLSGVLKAKFEWDKINRLTAIEIPAVSRTEFFYDAMHRRYKMVEKTPSGANWTAGTTSYLFWDGTQLVQKRVGTSSTSTNVINYYGSLGEARRSGITNTNYYYTTDHLGSIREVTDSAKTVLAAYDYDPYGVRTQTYSSSSFDVEPGYTGHIYHKNPGLHLALYRAYDADLDGGWIGIRLGKRVGLISMATYLTNP